MAGAARLDPVRPARARACKPGAVAAAEPSGNFMSDAHRSVRASELADRPRQQQNLPPGLAPPPARDWRADRPGDLGGVRRRRARCSGRPGPERRLRVHARRPRPRPACASRRSSTPTTSIAVVAEIAGKRAARFGRAPVMADIDVAIALLGYDGLRRRRRSSTLRARLVHDAAHDYTRRRELVDAVPEASAAAADGRADRRASTSGGPAQDSLPGRRPDGELDGVSAFVLPDEYVELRASLRRLADEHIAPNAAEADEREEYPWASWEAWRDAGLRGLGVPRGVRRPGRRDPRPRDRGRGGRAGVRVVVAVHVHLEARDDAGARPRLRRAQAEVRARGSRRGSARRRTACRRPTRAATCRACAPGRFATATTTCSPAASCGSRTRA